MYEWRDGGMVNEISVTNDLGSAAIGKVGLGETAAGRTYDIAFDDVLADTKPGCLTLSKRAAPLSR